MLYRVECHNSLGKTSKTFLSEWYPSLGSALEAMQEHQQRTWQSVSLVPGSLPRLVTRYGLAAGGVRVREGASAEARPV